MEIVTGKAGVPHVSSADDGRRIAGEVGTGSYVLQTGGKLAPSLVDANTVRIATGDMIVQGRHIGVTAPEDVKVASGSQGKKRMDYICVHYTRDVSGSSPTLVEKVEWKVLQGTPGSSAVAPSVPKGSILDGDADVTVPICSVTFDGLTTGQPKLLIPELIPLADLGDSVSHMPRLITGTKVLNSRDTSCVLFSRNEFQKLFGRGFDRETDVVLAMSGDGLNIPVHVDSCQYFSDTGDIYVTFDRAWYNAIRINYAVALAGR